jgi:hypothetical protein
MSVIPLSAKDNEPREGTTTYGPLAPEDRADAGADKKMDAVINDALKHYPDDDAETPKVERKDLDTTLRDGLDKLETAQADQEAWTKSREARAELDTRYRGFGGDTGKTLDLFLQMADALKADPLGSAQEIARAYLKASRYNLDTEQPKAEAKKADDPIDPRTGQPYSRRKVLDRVIEGAIESATSERETFEATAKQRARLKELWPNLSFDQAMDRIRQVDRNLHKDPLSAAAELGAAFGMPVLPADQATQEAKHVERVRADHEVNVAASRLPGMNDRQLRQEMATIVADNRFQMSGDTQVDLQNAYHIAIADRQNAAAGHNWVRSQIDMIARTNEPLAKEIVHTMLHDSAFAKYAGNVDPIRKFHAAATWLASRDSNKRSVTRAQKALPVRSSSGAQPQGVGKGIDAHLNVALKDWS